MRYEVCGTLNKSATSYNVFNLFPPPYMKMRSGITCSIFSCCSVIFVDEVCGMRYEDMVP